MKKIAIIGCGFGGLSCCARLARHNRKKIMEITVIDPRTALHFLPCLPDIFGRGLSTGILKYEIEKVLKKMGCNFIKGQASQLDLKEKIVYAAGQKISYDYLVIASGSETNFYDNEAVKKYGYRLDSADDALKIKKAVQEGNFDNFIIAGGGYTGIEAATNLALYLRKARARKRVIVVERGASILGPLPEWMKDYTIKNLKKMNIEVATNSSVNKIEGPDIRLTSGESFNNAMLVWAAGVMCADFIQKLEAKKNAQGRLEVDEYMRLSESVFAIGDAALFKYRAGSLRMAVQFAIGQGKRAAVNILRSISGKPLRKYQAIDLGYIIPMANNRSCGVVLGVSVRGWVATFLHYWMCIYRIYSLKNRIGMIRDLMTGGA